MPLIPFSDVPDAVRNTKQGVAVRVILNCDDFEKNHRNHYHQMLGFSGSEAYKVCTILSEIWNMPGHYVVLGNNGEIVSGLHGDIFYLDTDDLPDHDDYPDFEE